MKKSRIETIQDLLEEAEDLISRNTTHVCEEIPVIDGIAVNVSDAISSLNMSLFELGRRRAEGRIRDEISNDS